MDIKTKFNIGEKVFTIDPKTMKIKQFTVDRMSIYVTDQKASVYLSEGDSYLNDSYSEDLCFSSEAELMTYIKAV